MGAGECQQDIGTSGSIGANGNIDADGEGGVEAAAETPKWHRSADVIDPRVVEGVQRYPVQREGVGGREGVGRCEWCGGES